VFQDSRNAIIPTDKSKKKPLNIKSKKNIFQYFDLRKFIFIMGEQEWRMENSQKFLMRNEADFCKKKFARLLFNSFRSIIKMDSLTTLAIGTKAKENILCTSVYECGTGIKHKNYT